MNDPIYCISSLTLNTAKNCVNIVFNFRYEGKLQYAFVCVDYTDETQSHLTRELSLLGSDPLVEKIIVQAMRDNMYHISYPERDIIV